MPDAAAAEAYAVRIDDPLQTTFVVRDGARRHAAAAALRCGPLRAIVLANELPSDLTGFMSVIAGAFAERNIPIVPIGAASRDHLLVPAAHWPEALAILRGLRDASRRLHQQRLMDALALRSPIPAPFTGWCWCAAGDGGWSRLVGTPVTLREGVGVKLVATVGTRDETETVRPAEWADAARRRCSPSRSTRPTSSRPPATCTPAARRRAGCWSRRASPSRPEDVAVAAHDRRRGRALDLDDPEVVRAVHRDRPGRRLRPDPDRARDKERQLQHYLELLRPLAVLQGEGRCDPRRRLRQGVHEPRARARTRAGSAMRRR